MIETDRLLLREWRPADAEPFAALHWRRYGFGLYALEVKDSGEDAGVAGLTVPSFLPTILPAVELGWRIAPEHRRRGYATEAAGACLAHAFGPLGRAHVVSMIAPGNTASVRVAEKLGMTRGADRLHPVSRERLAVYQRSAPARDRAAERQPERVQAEQRQRGGVAGGTERALVDPGEA